MTTIRDICERAFRKIGVVAEDEAMTADQSATALGAFNDMLHGWAMLGIDINYTDKELGDAFPLEDRYREATMYCLAQRLAESYGRPVNFDAERWFRVIQAEYTSIPGAKIPRSITRTSSQRRYIEGF